MSHKSGFVNIIGKPNAGKSTLMNLLVGEQISIITPKAQTTRHRIIGIVNQPEYQIVFSDTPGILKPNYKLQESMMKFVDGAITDADVVLAMVELGELPSAEHEIVEKINRAEVPVILAINKIDLGDQATVMTKIDTWQTILPKATIIPISALSKFNADALVAQILEWLPEGPAYYDKDALTDKSERFFVSEILREKILKFYQKEIPYSIEVVIDEFKEEPLITKIRAIIIVSRDSQKGIIIGHQGKAIKKVATEARKDMEKFLDKKVFLETFVKVDKDWRDNETRLKNYGYLD
ncbi:MAG: GTPase Era [Bacteroidota bacterium]